MVAEPDLPGDGVRLEDEGHVCSRDGSKGNGSEAANQDGGHEWSASPACLALALDS